MTRIADSCSCRNVHGAKKVTDPVARQHTPVALSRVIATSAPEKPQTSRLNMLKPKALPNYRVPRGAACRGSDANCTMRIEYHTPQEKRYTKASRHGSAAEISHKSDEIPPDPTGALYWERYMIVARWRGSRRNIFILVLPVSACLTREILIPNSFTNVTAIMGTYPICSLLRYLRSLSSSIIP